MIWNFLNGLKIQFGAPFKAGQENKFYNTPFPDSIVELGKISCFQQFIFEVFKFSSHIMRAGSLVSYLGKIMEYKLERKIDFLLLAFAETAAVFHVSTMFLDKELSNVLVQGLFLVYRCINNQMQMCVLTNVKESLYCLRILS